MNFKQTVLFFLGTILLMTKKQFSSMFPNTYQYYISKTELKTRAANQYSIPFVDAQMLVPQQDTQSQEMICCAIWQGGYSFNETNNNFGSTFSINHKNTLLIIGDKNTDRIKERDIRAEFIRGTSDTDATLSLKGKQNFDSLRIFIQFPLEKLTGQCYLHNWFLTIRSSITQLAQKLSIEILGTPFNSIANMYHFFKDITPYAKIDNCQHTATDIENITLTIDGIYMNKKRTLQLYYYSGVELPTHTTTSTPYLFYPLIGNNGNIGLILGCDMRSYFYDNDTHSIGILCEFENHYLFYKTVDRVFDLFQQNDRYFSLDAVNSINKPWSRYLPSYNFKINNENSIPINNATNLPTRLHECNNCDLSLGFIYHYNTSYNLDYYLSLGYNLWISQPEYIELQDRIYPQQYQNFYNQGIAGSTPKTTSSQSTIENQAPNDTVLTHCTINDLDYSSAASDGGFSQGVFLRLSALQKQSWNVLLGSWFEIGKKAMIPSRYGFWAGLGYEF